MLNSGKHNSQVLFVSRQGLYQDLSQFTRNRERKIPSFHHPGHPGPSCASFIRSMGLGLLVRFFFFSFGIFGTQQYCNTSFHFISAAGKKKKKLFCFVIGKHCPGMQEEVHLGRHPFCSLWKLFGFQKGVTRCKQTRLKLPIALKSLCQFLRKDTFFQHGRSLSLRI